MATRKTKKGTERMFIGATKKITVGFFLPGAEARAKKIGKQATPSWFTFWPNRINIIPADVWGALLAKKSSPDETTGEQHPGAVEGYLQKQWLWEISQENAQRIHEGKKQLVSPAGPNANRSDYVPPEIDTSTFGLGEGGQLSAQQKALIDSKKSTDPQLNQIDMGEVPTSQVRPPPAPVVG